MGEKRKKFLEAAAPMAATVENPYVSVDDWGKLPSTVTQNAMVKAKGFNFYICDNIYI
jgi:hypothetical protein